MRFGDLIGIGGRRGDSQRRGKSRRRRAALEHLGAVEALEARELLAASPVLVDINTAPRNAQLNNEQFTAGSTLLFTNYNSPTGQYDLWRSDGTAAGTSVILPNSGYIYTREYGDAVDVGGTAYFEAYNVQDGGYNDLWKSNGTAAGTAPVVTVAAGGPAYPRYLTNVGGTLFFLGVDATTNSLYVYKSDGTAAGTKKVGLVGSGAGAAPASRDSVAVGGKYYFTYPNSTTGVDELWVSDGTAAGTKVVKSAASGGPNYPRELQNVNGKLMFLAINNADGTGNDSLWTTDGTAAGTKVVKTPAAGGPQIPTWWSNPTAVVGSTLYLAAYDPAGTGNIVVWKSDGTAAGTVAVKTTAGSVLTNPNGMVTLGGNLIFEADSDSGRALWKTDGTAAGTALVDPGLAELDPTQMTVVGTTVYFEAYDVYGSSGYELWKTDGTAAGTQLVSDIIPGFDSSNPTNLAGAGSRLWFQATTPGMGTQLWTSDGTAAGTNLVEVLDTSNDGSYPQSYTVVGNMAFFAASDPVNGNALWKTDGTAAGTTPVIKALSSYPTALVNLNGTLYFSLDNKLWKSDGTAAGTVVVVSGGPVSVSPPVNVNGVLYFSAYNSTGLFLGVELWRSDGTAAGTRLVKDIYVGSNSSNPSNLLNANGTLYFSAYNPAESQYELYKSNGTAAGTSVVVTVAQGGPVNPSNLVFVNNTLYFSGFNSNLGQYILYKSDGTAAGTVPVPAPAAGTPTGVTNLVAFNNAVYFVGYNPTDGYYELWKSDGTAAGTTQIVNSTPAGLAPVNPSNLIVANGRLWFQAYNPAEGYYEFWTSDGTAAGTALVKTVAAGGPINPTNIIGVNSLVYFTADKSDGSTGQELWRSDGTAAGTVLVADLLPGASASGITGLTNLNGALLFSANDGTHGPELWIVPSPPPVLGGFPASAKYYAGGTGVVLAPAATYSDPAGFQPNSKLVVTISGAQATDKLTIGNQGAGAGKVGISGSNVTYSGVTIGTFSGGSGSTALTVTFNSAVTDAAIQAVLRDILFSSTAAVPSTTPRPVQFVVTNGNQASNAPITVTTAVYDPPVLSGFGATVIYNAGAVPVPVAPTANVSDPQGAYASSVLTVTITANGEATDLLGVRDQGAGFSVSGTTITYANVAIATISGGSGAPLVVTFNASATQAGIRAVLQNVVYSSTAAMPGAATRSVGFSLKNGVAAPVGTASSSVNVNVPPVIVNPGGPATYVAGSAAVAVASTATVSDPDGDFANSVLKVGFAAALDPLDVLSILNVGTDPGQVGVSGTNVTFGGTTIATFAGGTSGNPLVVTFNASATQAAVQGVIDAVAFSNAGGSPSVLARTVQFQLTDGGSLTGPQISATVVVNSVPQIAILSPGATYATLASPVLVAPIVFLSDADGAYANSVLTVTDTNGDIADVLTLRNVGTGAGQVGISGANVTYGGVTIGTFAGGAGAASPLVVTFNASATQSAIQAVAQDVLFSSTSAKPPTTTRSIQFVVTDGASVPSVPATTALTIAGPPVVAGTPASVIYFVGAPPVFLAPSATVTDPQAKFGPGTMQVLMTNPSASDVVLLNNVGTGAGQVATFGNAVLIGGVTVGSFSGGVGTTPLVVTFNANATAAQVQTILRNVVFTNTSGTATTTARKAQFKLTDSAGAIGLSALVTVNLDTPPVLAGVGSAVAYNANAAAVLVAPSATFTSGPGYYPGAVLSVSIPGAAATDLLAVLNQGNGAGQVGVSAGAVKYGGVSIGTVTGGTGTSALVVTFNSAATQAAIQAVLRDVAYKSTSTAPSGTRTVQIVAKDGLGVAAPTMSTTVTINAAPTISGLASSVNYNANTAPILVASSATVADAEGNYAGSVLTVTNSLADSTVAVRNQGTGAGQVGISGTDVTFGGATVGSFTGGAGLTALVVTFNASATQDAIQAVLNNVTYVNTATAPTGTRTVTFQLADGVGALSVKSTLTVKINAAPVIAGLGSAVTYVAGGAPIVVASAATVTDTEGNYASSVLTVTDTTADGSDLLAIKSVGTAAGQVSVSGNTVSYGGVAVGTFSGGAGASPLVVTFNASATQAAIQAVVRNVTFSSTAASPPVTSRTVQFQMTDGLGANSVAVSKSVAVKVPPSLANVPASVDYSASAAQPVALAPSATYSDPNGAFSGTVLKLTNTNGATTDLLAIPNQGTGAGQIGVSGSNVTFGGIVVATFTGGAGKTSLVVTFNASATLDAIQAVLQNVTFKNTTAAPGSTTRAIQILATSGTGLSATANESVAITA